VLKSTLTLDNVGELSADELNAMQTVIATTIATVSNVDAQYISNVAIVPASLTESLTSSSSFKALSLIKILANLAYQASFTIQAPSQYLYSTLSSNPLFTGSSGSVGNILNSILSSGNGTVFASSLKDTIASSPDIAPAIKSSLSSKVQNATVAAVGVDDTSDSSGGSSRSPKYTRTEINIIIICTTVGTFVVALAAFLVYNYAYQPNRAQQVQQSKIHSDLEGNGEPNANSSPNENRSYEVATSKQPEAIQL
jgi:hypothetical protein